ncbi:DNRLRE domain-containing protein [Herbidospora galbida]|uniref:DNRLRE domain-containing protein n=1 Tax=Herbidospora galbida TaxID=2575442 RepID=UPI001484FF0F|nr:DNRLRE domain-containing protein [Herbidospora galbida]
MTNVMISRFLKLLFERPVLKISRLASGRFARTRRQVALVMVLTLPLSLMTVPASAEPLTQPPTAPFATPPKLPDSPAELALTQAKKDNRRVEIESMRSESATYYANPDGKTVRMELSTEPIRVRTADGRGFTPIDTTLVAKGGVITPQAAAGSLTLSDGQDKTLLKAGAVKITTPSVLPEPKLKGDTATYADAYGRGRDLQVVATASGFRQKIVIRQRPTGPVTFRVPMDLPEGLSFKDRADRPTIVDANGKKITEVRPTMLRDAKAADSTGAIDTGRTGRADVALADDGRTLVFTPDAAFLADPAVTYPVTLLAAADDWYEGHTGQWGDGGMDTWINDVDYQESWNTFTQDQIVVGKSYASNVAKRWRGYLEFPDIPETFAGATVDNADLHLWNYQSNECGISVYSGVTARRITSDWDELDLEWGSQPTVTNTGADTEYGAYGDDCTGSMGYAWDLTHSLNGIVQAWIDGATNYGIRLTAGNESDLRNWRRYRSEDAGGCRTAPLEDCKGQLHPPILTVDVELPEPPRRETVVITSSEPLTSIPEYEEALTRSVYLPEPGEVVPAMTEELVSANAQLRDGEGSLIGTDMLSPADPGEADDAGPQDGEDTVAPKVVSTEPADGAIEVPLDSPVRVTFSEPVAEVDIVLKDAQGVAVAGSSEYDPAEVVTFTPAQALKPGTTYTAEIDGAIDLSENWMGSHTWSFTTVNQVAGHWTFDEEDGRTAADSSGHDHHASLTETASWIAGKDGGAISNQPSQARIAAAGEAARSQKPVEVTDETTATSIMYALPDGTFRSEFTAGPIRVRQGEGWVPIDTGLVELDGMLKPRAVAAGVSTRISTGGSGQFVTMSTDDGDSYGLRWPTPLPKPTVKANVATYPDAAGKGADLVVTALPTGFRHDVVLRERPAKPLEIHIGVETGDLALTEGKGGRLLLSDGKKLVASAPRPVMVDASKANREAIAADVVTEAGKTELVLKPDHGFLSDPDTEYPVRVDPTITLPANDDVDVWASNVSGWPADPTAPQLAAGRYYGEFTRTHLRFSTADLAGATVTNAKLALTTIESDPCGTQAGAGIQVRRLTGSWSETALTWGNKPASTTEDAVTNRNGVGMSCDGEPGPMEWTITGIAQDWASGAANHGLVLMQPNETQTTQNYRIFASSEDYISWGSQPTLTVITAGPASAPAIGALSATPAQVVNGTTTITSLTPVLAGTLTDAAGGNLTGQFEIEHNGAQIWAGDSPAVASGNQALVTVPAGKLTDGLQIRWRARAASATVQSAWSAWQQAVVDVPNPTVGQFQVTPSSQANVTTSLTPTLHALVTDPAAQPLRAEFEVEGGGQTWTGAVTGVASGTQATVTVPAGTLTDGWQGRWRVRAVNTDTTIGSPWSDWHDLTVDLPDPVSEPAVAALQVSPSAQVNGATVTSTRTPSLLVQVADPAGKPLRAEAEIEHDGAQIWTGAADNVPAGTQAGIPVPAGTLTDGWQVRWRARALSATATSAWSDWQTLTVTVPKPTATGAALTPSKVVDGATVTTTLTPRLTATLTNPTGQPLRAEAEIEHDGAQVWTGGVDGIASGAQATITVPAGELTDGWQIRWRLRAVAGQDASPWSDWQQVTIDVTQPGEEPLAQTDGPVINTDQSFTVAAWSRWSDKDGDFTLAEQKGTHQAPFRLGNTPGDGLVFTLTSADTANATTEGVLSGVEPPVDEWFHLAGVYDATAGTASLYLNGALVSTAPVSFPAWHADSPTTLGSKVRGDLDDLRLFQRPLDATEIAALETGPVASRSKAPMMQTAMSNTGGDFDYERVNLQNCQVSGTETGYAVYDARIREKPYNSCWSSYLYMQDYEEDDSTGRMKKSFCKSFIRHRIAQGLCGVGEELFDDDYALRFRATWVMDAYLGDATGNSVVDGAGTGIKPTDIRVWFMIDEFAIVDDDGSVVVPGSALSGLPISLEIRPQTGTFSDGSCEADHETKTKDISAWRTSPWELFKVSATVDPSDAFICTIAPYIIIDDSGIFDIEIKAWSDKALDSEGKVVGIRRHGVGAPHFLSWVPNFRCDSLKFGANNPDVPDRFRGCINTRAKRVFVMSKSDDSEFIEIIDHIEDALEENNSHLQPPLRPGHDWSRPGYPPTRKPVGGRQNKFIYGNWAAPRYDEDGDDDRGKPLVRGTPGETPDVNRKHFSRINLHMDVGTVDEMNWLISPPLNDPNATEEEIKKDKAKRAREAASINLCKYYMPEKYNPPYRADKMPYKKSTACDEYPFASTINGAAYAEGHYSIRAVNGRQNKLQGDELLAFYGDYRVGADNPFWVLISP